MRKSIILCYLNQLTWVIVCVVICLLAQTLNFVICGLIALPSSSPLCY